MVIIRTERAARLPLVRSLHSTALLLARHQVPPELLYVLGARLFLHTHTYTRTDSLYFCYTAASGAENKKSRFVLACFLPLLPLSSILSPSLSFLLLLPYHVYLVSFSPPLKSLGLSVSLITSYAVLWRNQQYTTAMCVAGIRRWRYTIVHCLRTHDFSTLNTKLESNQFLLKRIKLLNTEVINALQAGVPTSEESYDPMRNRSLFFPLAHGSNSWSPV